MDKVGMTIRMVTSRRRILVLIMLSWRILTGRIVSHDRTLT